MLSMKPTVSALDVGKYILKVNGPMTAMKLQKLVYYCQAWSLVWDQEPMFKEKIKAWVNGPVVPQLYAALKGRFTVDADNLKEGDENALGQKARDTVKAVLKFYGDRTAQWLSDLTHSERPWVKAREGVPPGEPSGKQISEADIAEYYASLKKN